MTGLLVGRAIKSVSIEVGPTKTGAIKPALVHPAIEKILGAWVDAGWAEMMGRAPRPDDLLVPNRLNGARKVGARAFKRDLARLGMRERFQLSLPQTPNPAAT